MKATSVSMRLRIFLFVFKIPNNDSLIGYMVLALSDHAHYLDLESPHDHVCLHC